MRAVIVLIVMILTSGVRSFNNFGKASTRSFSLKMASLYDFKVSEL